MLRRPVNSAFILGSGGFFYTNRHDIPAEEIGSVPKPPEIKNGWDRVKLIFVKDEFGKLSPTLAVLANIGYMSIFAGGLYGGVIHSRAAYVSFMENNQATSFDNHFEAKKQLQTQVTNAFAKGAFKWGWRITAFTLIYTSVSSIISVYRDKNGIIEHTVGGGTAGFLYKFMSGPRAWIVGGGLGMVLGTIGGSVTYSILKISGISMNDIGHWSSKYNEMRKRLPEETIKMHVLQDRDSQLLQEHNAMIGKKGEGLHILDKE